VWKLPVLRALGAGPKEPAILVPRLVKLGGRVIVRYMTASVTAVHGLVERDSIPVCCCAISAHGVPDPVHADGALCPEELRWLIGRLLAGHYAAMLLLDWAFVPNNPVFAAVSDRGSGQEGHGGDDGEDETHLW